MYYVQYMYVCMYVCIHRDEISRNKCMYVQALSQLRLSRLHIHGRDGSKLVPLGPKHSRIYNTSSLPATGTLRRLKLLSIRCQQQLHMVLSSGMAHSGFEV